MKQPLELERTDAGEAGGAAAAAAKATRGAKKAAPALEEEEEEEEEPQLQQHRTQALSTLPDPGSPPLDLEDLEAGDGVGELERRKSNRRKRGFCH